jgi:HD superfamily phosphohydrolase
MLNFNAKININVFIDQVKIINNNFSYPEQSINDIISLFTTRHKLHIQIYNHKAVVSTQLMITDIINQLDDILNISNSVNNMDIFCDMTDSYIINSVKLLKRKNNLFPELSMKNINIANDIIQKIESRQLYKMIYYYISKTDIDLTLLKNIYNNDNYVIFKNKIGFVSGNKKNPIDSILLYNTKNNNFENINKNKKYMTLLLPDIYQEFIIIIYCKNNNDDDNKNFEIIDYCNNLFK